MTDYSTLNEEELIKQYEILWARYMYYQAAEGNWNKEAEARGVATKEYWDCMAELDKRGIKI